MDGESIETIYFGGGTPSLLSEIELATLLEKIYSNFNLDAYPEITLEANPDDLSFDKIKSLHKNGINRLSIGIQSFLESDLQFLKRAHNSEQAKSAIAMAQDIGISNITIDLIYGIPNQTDAIWLENLNLVHSLGIPHFSAYSLTVEPKTQLDFLINQKKLLPVDDEQTATHFMLLMNWAESKGYEHYEISNFCLPQMYSRHNSSYWQGKKYIGLGPSAHSYNGVSRQWNIANNELYIKNLNKAKPYFEIEILSAEEKFNEYLLTSLRTKWGCDLKKIALDFDKLFIEDLEKHILKYLERGYLSLDSNILRLTKSGKFLADNITSDLFRG